MSSRISSNINFGRSRQFHVYQSTYRQCEDPEINTNKEPVKEDEKNDEIPDIFGEIDESSTEKEEEKNEEEEKRIVLTLENLKVNFEDLKKIGMSDNMWECMNQQGLSYPQHASVELETEMLLNGVKVVQSGVGHDGYNVQKLSVYFSQDSTNGEDGHWVKMGETIMRNSYNDWKNIFFPPTTATWVRVQVDQGFNQDKFAISELKIYEAPYVCDPDYDRFGDLY